MKSNFIIITIFLGCAIWKPGNTAPRPIVPHQCPVNSRSSSQNAALFSWHKVQQISLKLSLYNFCSICISSLNLVSSICLYDCSIKWEDKSKHVQNCCMKMLQTKGKPCNSYVGSPLETTCVYQQPTTRTINIISITW